MHFYLAPYSGNGSSTAPFSLPEVNFTQTASIDLRPDQKIADGYGLLCVPQRDDAQVKSGIYLGTDIDLDTMAATAKTIFQSKFFVTLQSTTLRNIIAEYMASGRVPHFKAINGRWRQDISGLRLFDVPVISGAAGPYVDTFNRADNTALGSFSDGSGIGWTEFDAAWEIKTNQAIYNSTTGATQYNLAHIDTDLSTDGHYANADITVGASSFDGIILRKDNTGTKTYYIADLRGSTQQVRFLKVVADAVTQLATSSQTINNGSTYTLYAEITTGDSYTVKFQGSTVLGPTTDTSITGNLRTGMGCLISVAGNVKYDNFTTADLGGVTVVIPAGLAGGLVQNSEDALSPYRLVVA